MEVAIVGSFGSCWLLGRGSRDLPERPDGIRGRCGRYVLPLSRRRGSPLWGSISTHAGTECFQRNLPFRALLRPAPSTGPPSAPSLGYTPDVGARSSSLRPFGSAFQRLHDRIVCPVHVQSISTVGLPRAARSLSLKGGGSWNPHHRTIHRCCRTGQQSVNVRMHPSSARAGCQSGTVNALRLVGTWNDNMLLCMCCIRMSYFRWALPDSVLRRIPLPNLSPLYRERDDTCPDSPSIGHVDIISYLGFLPVCVVVGLEGVMGRSFGIRPYCPRGAAASASLLRGKTPHVRGSFDSTSSPRSSGAKLQVPSYKVRVR